MTVETQIKISVIVPVYNVEKYLDESLESLTTQKFDGFEIIIVNDGSTDSCEEIILKYTRSNSNIIVINQNNMGLSGARNSGIKIARGEYIYFFDSDDILPPNALETMFAEVYKDDIEMLLFSGDVFFDKSTKFLNGVRFNYIKKEKYEGTKTGLKILYLLTKNGEYSPSACLYIIKREVISRNSLFFYENIIHEDLLFTYKLLLLCSRVKVINNVLFKRRIRKGSIMTTKNYEKSFNSLYIILNEMLRITDKNEITEPYGIFATKKQISDVYGNILRNYIKIENKEINLISTRIKEVKLIGLKNLFFKRADFFIFFLSTKIYKQLRNIFDKIRKYT